MKKKANQYQYYQQYAAPMPGMQPPQAQTKKTTGLVIGVVIAAVVMLAAAAGSLILLPKLISPDKPVQVQQTPPAPSAMVPGTVTPGAATPEPTPNVGRDPDPTPDGGAGWSEWTETLPAMVDADGYEIERKLQYRSAPIVHFDDESGITGSYTVVRETAGDWIEDEEWQEGDPEEFEETATERISQTRTLYTYRETTAYYYYPEGDVTHTQTMTGYRTTTFTSEKPLGGLQYTLLNTKEEYIVERRETGYDCVDSTALGEFRNEPIAHADGTAVNVRTVYRYRPYDGERTPAMDNFRDTSRKFEGVLADVPESQWYHDPVYSAWSIGALSAGEYLYVRPADRLTAREAVEAAVCLRLTYEGLGDAVYGVDCVEYALENGIIDSGDFADLDAAVTREEAVYVLSKALPQSELAQVNGVNGVADLDPGSRAYDAVMQFARAGILSVSGKTFSFNPANTITRAEAAAMISRLAFPDTRVVNG